MSKLYRIEYKNLEYDSDSFTYMTSTSVVEASRKFKGTFLGKLSPTKIEETEYAERRTESIVQSSKGLSHSIQSPVLTPPEKDGRVQETRQI